MAINYVNKSHGKGFISHVFWHILQCIKINNLLLYTFLYPSEFYYFWCCSITIISMKYTIYTYIYICSSGHQVHILIGITLFFKDKVHIINICKVDNHFFLVQRQSSWQYSPVANIRWIYIYIHRSWNDMSSNEMSMYETVEQKY